MNNVTAIRMIECVEDLEVFRATVDEVLRQVSDSELLDRVIEDRYYYLVGKEVERNRDTMKGEVNDD